MDEDWIVVECQAPSHQSSATAPAAPAAAAAGSAAAESERWDEYQLSTRDARKSYVVLRGKIGATNKRFTIPRSVDWRY